MQQFLELFGEYNSATTSGIEELGIVFLCSKLSRKAEIFRFYIVCFADKAYVVVRLMLLLFQSTLCQFKQSNATCYCYFAVPPSVFENKANLKGKIKYWLIDSLARRRSLPCIRVEVWAAGLCQRQAPWDIAVGTVRDTVQGEECTPGR